MKNTQGSTLQEIRRFSKDIDLCMKCGFCLSACPVYKEELEESAVARGKNALVKGLLNGQAQFTPELAKRLDKCTLCKTCAVNCPAGVDIPSVVIAARADQCRQKGVGFPYNIIYKQILPHRVLFGWTVKIAGLAQKVFFPRHGEGTLRHLPMFLSGLGHNRHIPQVAPRFLRQSLPPGNKPPSETAVKLRVGYMLGCMTDFVYPETGKKIVDFLTRHGVEVIIPQDQGCCGAPVYLGAGDFVTGRKMADANVQAFKDLDYVIVDCATCGSAIKDYEKYLADTEERHKAYADLAKKTIHVTAFLVDVLKLPGSAYRVVPEVKGKTVTWHDPCHLARHMGVREQPRRILKSIPDIRYVEMVEADRCCGMAGSFSLKFYELSTGIAERKLKNIVATGADIVVSGCPGCEIQLKDIIARHNLPIQVMHIMELFSSAS